MWLTTSELEEIGFRSIGTNVLVDDSVRIYGAEYVCIGSHVRIDAETAISAGPGAISIGNHVHIGHGALIYGAAGVEMADFSGLSARVCVFSESDDYTGLGMTNPTVPMNLRRVRRGVVSLGRHAVVGVGSVLLPGVSLAQYAAAGALTVVNRDVGEGTIVSGHPMTAVGTRDMQNLTRLETELNAERST